MRTAASGQIAAHLANMQPPAQSWEEGGRRAPNSKGGSPDSAATTTPYTAGARREILGRDGR
ncbi:MAG: hypothetical protein IPG56_18610 [Caulobacteraceae bacterium]|nr:hypothetical protein [Caulobacteraceae bacterium]